MAREHFKKHGAEHYWDLALSESVLESTDWDYCKLFLSPLTFVSSVLSLILLPHPAPLVCVISERCQADIWTEGELLAPFPSQPGAALYSSYVNMIKELFLKSVWYFSHTHSIRVWVFRWSFLQTSSNCYGKRKFCHWYLCMYKWMNEWMDDWIMETSDLIMEQKWSIPFSWNRVKKEEVDRGEGMSLS